MALTQGLHVFIALLNTRRKIADGILTSTHQSYQKPALFSGIERTYRPINDGDALYPSESKIVEQNATSMLHSALTSLADHYDTQLTQDKGNQSAMADLVVDGKVLIKDAPATFLLFLEKKLVDLGTLINKMPTLTTNSRWEKDPTTGNWMTEPRETIKQKKIQKPITLAPATDKHPAQVQMASDDVIEGYWTTTDISSAFSPSQVNEMKNRLNTLVAAVKTARENANKTEVEYQNSTLPVLKYIFN